MQATVVLILAGALVWAIAGLRVIASLLNTGGNAVTLLNLGAWLGFGLAFFIHVQADRGRRGVAALAVQTLCGLVLAVTAGAGGMEIALLVMVAGQLPTQMSGRASLFWIAAQTGALAILLDKGRGLTGVSLVIFLVTYLAFELFAMGTAQLAESERTTREALAAANVRLEAMQAAAVDTARHAERLRIARDLHDSLGHRLTALGLTLEAARHLPAEAVSAKIVEARGLASGLLDDLRDAVGEIRDDETRELRSLLEDLARSIESPRVSVQVDDGVRITGPEATTALYRIAQEIVTNAARHSKATRLDLSLRSAGEDALLEGVDDGAGSTDEVIMGNGLAGIRERARLLGGDARWSRDSGGGFRVVATIPRSRLV